MSCPEERLYIAIIKQAVKDFHRGCKTDSIIERQRKKTVVRWVANEEGTFPLCAVAYGSDPRLLKEKLLKTFKRLENGEELRQDKST